MDKPKWTPGPWRLDRYSGPGRLYIATPATTIALIDPGWNGGAETEANASVLRAASQMADAMHALLADVFFSGADDCFCEVCEQAAPADSDGTIIGRVRHAEGCAYAAARAALRSARGED